MKIVWSLTAEITYEAEIEYIIKKWNIKQATLFYNLVEEHLERLKTFPLLGKPSKDNDRYIVISKQTTLIYRVVNNKTIELLLFWNNKWNPEDFVSFLN